MIDGLNKVQRTFLLYELAGKQEHHSLAIDFPLGSQFISLWQPARRFLCEARIVERVRNDEKPLRASAVMQKILPRQCAHGQAGIQARNEPTIERVFRRPPGHAAIGSQMRITPHHDRSLRAPAGAHCLPGAFVIPTINDHRIEALLVDDFFNLWRIHAAKCMN